MADMYELNLFSSVPFYLTRLVVFTFPAFVFLLPRIQSFRQIILSPKSCMLNVELNALSVLFPLIYLMILFFMGTRHYHYLTPLILCLR